MHELSRYQFEPLWAEGDFVLSRSVRDAALAPLLVMAPVLAQPAPESLQRLAHAYALREALEPTWATRPLALVRHQGRPTLVLADPGGEVLARLVGQPWEVTPFLRVAIGLAVALGRLHARGLIHKDVKPAHILVHAATGDVWLTGFGIASRLPRERQASEPPEIIAGTLAYMAPEQTGRMNRSIDARSDLYALGVTLYELLTGGLPFIAADPLELVHCHIARRPVPPAECVPGLSPAISAIVMKLLAKTAEDRYQTAAGVAADLRHCLTAWETSGGSVEPFPLGAHDVPDVLRIPEKLYGREQEVRSLLAAFERVVARGMPELVLVSGFSGIGKSSLVHELHKAPCGLFVSAKCDQYKRDIPYATLAQALQTLERQFLVKSEAELAVWRASVLSALGANGRLVVDLVPELEILIGPQPPVPDLPLREAENRFLAILGRFLAVFARSDHPLVLFLDDLQWLDPATLQFLARVVSPPTSGALLAIGAYRDNEVGPDHPLRLMLESVRKAGALVQDIVLGPLSRDDLARMVAESVGCGLRQAEPLGRLIHDKTAGNPFFASQFLTTLCEEHLLAFDPTQGAWRWDIDDIRAQGFTDNVVELMVGKLKRFPAATQEALQRFACLGNSTDSATLAVVRGGTAEAVHSELWDAVREGLVYRRGDSYRFLHDRVQEAAYALIPEDRRPEEHVRIGRRLLSHLPQEAVSDRVFEIVNQLNRGVGLITDLSERETLRQLNAQAGRRAKNATAYASARGYLIQATALLRTDSWRTQYEDTFTVQLERCECEYLTGNFDVAQDLSRLILENARSDIDRAQVYRLRIRLSELAGRFADAPTALRDALQLFGMTLPESAADIQAASEAENREVTISLRGRRAAELVDAPAATDLTVQMIISLIAESLSLASAWAVQHSYFPLLAARGVNVCLGHGNTAESSSLYQGYARARVDAGDFQSAFEFSDMALRLAAKFENPRLQAIVLYRHGLFVNPWRSHIATSLPYLHQGFSALVKAGDFLYAGYAGVMAIEMSLEKGDRLDDVLETCRKYADVVTQSHNRYTLRLQQHFIACLKGSPREPTSFEDPAFSDADRPVGIAGLRFHVLRQIVCFLFGRYDEALEFAGLAAEVLRSTVSLLLVATHRFYRALTLVALYPRATAARQHAFRQTLDEELRRHRRWADNCPANFEHRYALLAAEVARIDGQDLEAMRLYEQAIRSARENGFVQNEALANELAGRFYLDRRLETNGYAHLHAAHACYALWGADGKVRHLERLYPCLAAPARAAATSGVPVQQLDVTAVVTASQAVSSEIVLPKLIETLMTMALENAGADLGLLILPHGEAYRIEAEARASDGQVEVELSQATITGSTCPDTLLRYVIRTHERVILDDASRPNLFSEDEYLHRRPPTSILCLPLVKQGRLVGLLYLENTLTSHAFTPDRVAVLELLAAQAAIALENTRLYSDLQAREAQIRRLVDANIIGIVISEVEGRILETNDAFLDLVGYSREDLVSGRIRWKEMTPPAWHAASQRAVAQIRATGRCEPFEKEYVRKDGSRVPVLVGAAAFEGGRLESVAFVLDLTERKRADEERQAHLRFLESMDKVNRAAQGTNDLEQMMRDVLGAVLSIFACDRAWLVYPCDPEAPSHAVQMQRTRPEFPGPFALGVDVPMDQDDVGVFHTVRAASGPVQFGPGSEQPLPAGLAKRFSVQSRIAMAVYPKLDRPYMFGLSQCSYPRVWTPQEERLFQEIGRRLEDALTSLLMLRNLRESERKLEAAQRLTHVGYWERDPETDRITWSDETYRIFGLQPQAQILNLAQLPALIHPEDKQIMVQAVAEALRGGRRYDVEYRVVRPNGEVRLVHSQGDVMRDESGRPRRMFGTVQDITERKRAEQRLVAQHTVTQILAEAATLQDATPQILQAVCECLGWDLGALWSLDRQAGVLRCVEVWQKASVEAPHFEATSRASTFLPGIGLPGRVWSSRAPAYIPDVVYDANCPRAPIAAREGLHTAFGFPILLGGDVLGVMEFFSHERRQSDQDLLHMMATIGSQIGQFIERKRAEEALRASEASLAEGQQISHTGSWRWNVRTSEVRGSAEHSRICGFDPAAEQRPHRRYRERVHPDDRPAFAHLIDSAVRDKRAFQHEYRLLLPDGVVKHVQSIGHPDTDAAGDLEFTGTIMDVTARKRAEEALRHAQSELTRVARLTTMGELAASIAHEINQPLAAIVTNGDACARLLAGNPPNLGEAREAVAAMIRDGLRASDVIRRIRALVQKTPPPPEWLDVNALILEVLALTRSDVQRHGVALQTHLAMDLPPVRGDRIQVQQVLLNLLVNAIDALRGVPEEARTLQVSSGTDASQAVRVAVCDAGIGLAAESLAHLFDAFYTTKPEGMGLGLAISRTIIEAHGGQLWATPNAGPGATLQFTLPAGGEQVS